MFQMKNSELRRHFEGISYPSTGAPRFKTMSTIKWIQSRTHHATTDNTYGISAALMDTQSGHGVRALQGATTNGHRGPPPPGAGDPPRGLLVPYRPLHCLPVGRKDQSGWDDESDRNRRTFTGFPAPVNPDLRQRRYVVANNRFTIDAILGHVTGHVTAAAGGGGGNDGGNHAAGSRAPEVESVGEGGGTDEETERRNPNLSDGAIEAIVSHHPNNNNNNDSSSSSSSSSLSSSSSSLMSPPTSSSAIHRPTTTLFTGRT